MRRMKKSKPKTTAKKAAKKRSAKVRKATTPVEMRQCVTDMVGSEIKSIARAVVDEAKKGQLATVKYLFDLSGVYPSATGQSQAGPEEGETLARMLLSRLGLPLEPVLSEDDDVLERHATPAEKRAATDQDIGRGQRKDEGEPAEPKSGDIEEQEVPGF